MAAYGGGDIAGAGAAVSTLDTASINVTGSDLCLVAAGAEDNGATNTFSFVWDPTGNNESMTGLGVLGGGTYLDGEMAYLDDPTAANAAVRMTMTGTASTCAVMGAFFTAAGNIVATDYATDSFATTGTSVSATPSNVTTGDMVIDFTCTAGYNPAATMSVGANQTQRGTAGSGPYANFYFSTQAGADGGVMSWTVSNADYGAILLALRIPDSGGGPTGPDTPQGLHGIHLGINVQRSSRLGGELES